MNILIIEDEKLAAEKLETYLNEINPEYKVVGSLSSVDKSISWLNNNQAPDLILSDIHLADGICFKIFEEVEFEGPVIFITAYDKYAIQAFEVNSIDYLLKPITKERLVLSINKYDAIKRLNEAQKTDMYNEFKNLLSQKNKEYKSRFLCKLGNKIKSVPVTSIKYFFSKDKMSFIITEDKKKLPVNNTLDEIDQMIDPNSFFRVNRQFIAHFDSIDEIHPYFKGRLKIKLNPETDNEIIVSTERTPLFKAWLDR